MKTLLYFAVFSLTLCFTASAHADSIVVDPVSSGLVGGGSVNGTVTIDTTAGTVTGVNVDVVYDSSTFLFNTVAYFDPNNVDAYLTAKDAGGDELLLAFNTPSFSGFVSGEVLCTMSAPCPNFQSFLYTKSDTQVLLAPTPEPSSLVLLGTGILGAAGAVRRRFSRE